jgi:hypothetical protein
LQHGKQPFWARLQLLVRLPLNTRNDTANKPARLAQFDDGNDRTILVQGDGRCGIGCRPSLSASLPVSAPMTPGIPSAGPVSMLAISAIAGLTGSPDESGAQRREQGLARAGNARVRRGMIQLAWRFLMFQKESALAVWYRARTADSRRGTRKTMIVALARKLIIALWRFVTTVHDHDVDEQCRAIADSTD